jgi:ferritin-like metal-binding protein YciE
MRLTSLRDLLIANTRDLYDAEHRIIRILDRFAKAASSEELAAVFHQHFTETEEHVKRLEQVFVDLGETPRKRRCYGIIGLVDDGRDVIDENADPTVRDAALIGVAQRIAHFEIAAYGCARTWAEMLGLEGVAEQFDRTLEEEGMTDKKLTAVAETVNADAMRHVAEVRETARRTQRGRGAVRG